MKTQKENQTKVYSKNWNEFYWQNERLFPVCLDIEEILSKSTAEPFAVNKVLDYNVIGCPRNGTKWLQTIIQKVLKSANKRKIFELPYKKNYLPKVGHHHLGNYNDFSDSKANFFIYRDIRDAIVSGYFYLRSGKHQGTMGSTPEAFNSLSKEDGLERHLITYMKYRMPVLLYWFEAQETKILKIKYEQLLENFDFELNRIITYLKLDISRSKLEEIKRTVSFENMSKGRSRGMEDVSSHQRKAVIGDWRNHFTSKHIDILEKMGGKEFLNYTGYDW